MTQARIDSAAWPELAYGDWQETCTTLHLWTQVIGKIVLSQAPWLNHSWHVTLRVTARGLGTPVIPFGERALQIEFDFIDHALRLCTSDGARRELALRPRSVADFFESTMAMLDDLGLPVSIDDMPSEIPGAIRFRDDRIHDAYDPEYARRFWRVLLQVDRVFQAFRTGFVGKCSPVQFFWGSFDLAVTRFSGRRAQLHPGGVPNLRDEVVREAYSHEVSSAGFWPGGGAIDYPAFYSYAYSEPEGYASAAVRPGGAFYHPDLHEFVLSYDAARSAARPEYALTEFLQSTYDAAADLGRWNRAELECSPGLPGVPRALA